MIVVAFSMLALTGMAAIAVDAGVGYNERRTTQNAADNAALAGAWALCHGESAADAANASATSNGYLASAVTVITPFDQAASVETTVDPDATVFVSIDATVDTTFGRTIGSSSIDVLSEAVATCSQGDNGLGAPALFAKGPSCSVDSGGNADVVGLTYSAGNVLANGNANYFGPVHADGDLHVGGNHDHHGTVHAEGNLSVNGNIDFDEAVTYGTSYNGIGNIDMPFGFPKEVSKELNLDYPVTYDATDYSSRPAGVPPSRYHYHAASWHQSGNLTIPEGLHYVNGSVQLNGNIDSTGPFTIVATGKITFQGNLDWTPYIDDLALLSDFGSESCNTVAILIRGNSKIDGLVFAPKGRISIHGNSVNGSVIGWDVETQGNFSVTADAGLLPSQGNELLLLK